MSSRLMPVLIAVLFGIALIVPYVSFAASVDCYCVLYLREILGVDVRGDAWTIKANAPLAAVEEGDVLLFDYGSVDHAALVVAVNSNATPATLTIQESNYHTCTPGRRTVAVNDPHIRGIYRPGGAYKFSPGQAIA